MNHLPTTDGETIGTTTRNKCPSMLVSLPEMRPKTQIPDFI